MYVGGYCGIRLFMKIYGYVNVAETPRKWLITVADAASPREIHEIPNSPIFLAKEDAQAEVDRLTGLEYLGIRP